MEGRDQLELATPQLAPLKVLQLTPAVLEYVELPAFLPFVEALAGPQVLPEERQDPLALAERLREGGVNFDVVQPALGGQPIGARG